MTQVWRSGRLAWVLVAGFLSVHCGPGGLTGGPFAIPEGSPAGTSVGTIAGASSGLTYRIASGNVGNAFTVSAVSGELLVLTPAALDFETTPTFTLTLEAAEGSAAAAKQSGTVVVHLTDANDPPSITAASFSIAENSAQGTSVGSLSTADSEPGQSQTFSLASQGNTSNAFAISASGQLSVATPSALDHETRPTFTLTVLATDNGSPVQTGSGQVTVTVTDVNEAPAPGGGPFGATLSMTNGAAIGTVAHNDPDVGQSHTFSILSGNAAGTFALNASTGQITVANSAQLNSGPWTLQVQVADNASPPLSGVGNIDIVDAILPVATDDSVFGLTGVAIDLNLFSNDTLGGASTTVASFGGGSVGGSVTTNAAGASVSLAGGSLQVTAAGHALLTATTAGTFTFSYRLQNIAGTDDATVTLRICPNLSVGGVYVADARSELCLEGGGSGAEYTVIPVNVHDTLAANVSMTGSNIVAVTGPPTPALVPSGVTFARPTLAGDERFEQRLRQQERALAPLMDSARAARNSGPRLSITPGVPVVGATMSLNAQGDFACSNADMRTATVRAVSTHAIVMSDNANPANGLSAQDYQEVATQFDSLVHPTITGNFGSPADIDTNSRVIIFYTSAVNALTPANSSFYVGGFFFSRDLFPTGSCATSNVGEMFYMLAADPSGTINNNVRSVAMVKNITVGTVAHEFQHLINASRRLYVNNASAFEDSWLDEGLAHVAEELIFYAASGLVPRANLTTTEIATQQSAFNQYMDANMARWNEWLLAPSTEGLFDTTDDLSTRGAAWAFLRYGADRRNGVDANLWFALVNTTATGRANVDAAFGVDSRTWMRDFAAATYADDVLSPATAFSHPSWNYRNIFTNLNYGTAPNFPLAVRNPTNNVAQAFSLSPGAGAAYLRMGVASTQRATVTTTVGGSSPASTLKIAIVRRE